MTVLLDTHALLWWLSDDPRLSRRARAAVADPKNRVLASAASGWEIATKQRLDKLPELRLRIDDLPDLLRQARIDVLPITMGHAIDAGSLPGPHRDPFDRMLIAQARAEQLSIVTADAVFRAYGASVLW